MQSLENYVDIFEGKSSNKDKSYLRAILKKYCVSHNIDFKTADKDPMEVGRFEMGTDEDVNKEFLKDAFKDTGGVSISDDDSEVVGRSKGASGTYKSYKITYNDEVYYVANKTQDKQTLHNKDLSPDKVLVLTESSNTFDNRKQLKDAVNRGLASLKEKHPEIVKCCDKLIDILDEGSLKREGSFKEGTADDFFNTSSEGRIELDLSSIKKYIEPIENGDIACIEKDFGEILGPFLFFRLFNDCKVVFPTVSNEPLIDYYINGYKVSAKQLGGGGKPAGKDLMLKTVANLKKNVENELDDLKKEKDQMNKKEKKAMYDYKEIEFINNIAISYSMSVFDQKNSLIQKYVVDKYLSNNEAFKKFKNLANEKHSKVDFSKINEILDSIVGDHPKEFFEEVYKAIGYNDTSHLLNKYDWDKINTENQPKLKYGFFIYPLWAICIKEINEEYGSENEDVISSIIHKAVDMKQVYFGIRKNKMILEVVSSGVSKWTFDVGGLSIPNPLNASLSIKLKHNKSKK